jgi:c-di-GMP-binding flagellar brake protein YcgR
MSTAIDGEEDFVERRAFPRLAANCPVLYRVKANERWLVASLDEYSATGFSMVCENNLAEGTEIAIQIKPGSRKTVPKLSAMGKVLRCEENDQQRFKISCKIIKVLRNP